MHTKGECCLLNGNFSAEGHVYRNNETIAMKITSPITFDQCCFVLDGALRGFREIYHHNHLPFKVQDAMIGINEKGIVRVWRNVDFSLDSCSGKQSHMIQMVTSIFFEVIKHCQEKDNLLKEIQAVEQIKFYQAQNILKKYIIKYILRHTEEQYANIGVEMLKKRNIKFSQRQVQEKGNRLNKEQQYVRDIFEKLENPIQKFTTPMKKANVVQEKKDIINNFTPKQQNASIENTANKWSQLKKQTEKKTVIPTSNTLSQLTQKKNVHLNSNEHLMVDYQYYRKNISQNNQNNIKQRIQEHHIFQNNQNIKQINQHRNNPQIFQQNNHQNFLQHLHPNAISPNIESIVCQTAYQTINNDVQNITSPNELLYSSIYIPPYSERSTMIIKHIQMLRAQHNYKYTPIGGLSSIFTDHFKQFDPIPQISNELIQIHRSMKHNCDQCQVCLQVKELKKSKPQMSNPYGNEIAEAVQRGVIKNHEVFLSRVNVQGKHTVNEQDLQASRRTTGGLITSSLSNLHPENYQLVQSRHIQ